MDNYTNQELATARHLVADTDMMDLLYKVLVDRQEQLHPDIVNAKSDNELGEIVRADSIARQKIGARFNELKRIGKPKREGGKSHVPS